MVFVRTEIRSIRLRGPQRGPAPLERTEPQSRFSQYFTLLFPTRKTEVCRRCPVALRPAWHADGRRIDLVDIYPKRHTEPCQRGLTKQRVLVALVLLRYLCQKRHHLPSDRGATPTRRNAQTQKDRESAFTSRALGDRWGTRAILACQSKTDLQADRSRYVARNAAGATVAPYPNFGRARFRTACQNGDGHGQEKRGADVAE
jgi:hypothetical protein